MAENEVKETVHEYVVAPNRFVDLAGKRYEAGEIVKLTDAQLVSIGGGFVSRRSDLKQEDQERMKAAGDAAKAFDRQSRGVIDDE